MLFRSRSVSFSRSGERLQRVRDTARRIRDYRNRCVVDNTQLLATNIDAYRFNVKVNSE